MKDGKDSAKSKARDKQHPRSTYLHKGLLDDQEQPIAAGETGRTRELEEKLLEGPRAAK